MMRQVLAVFAAHALSAAVVLGQERGQLSRQEADDIERELRTGRVTAALAAIAGQCDQSYQDSRSTEKSVSERATSAREALRCFDRLSAQIAALERSDRFVQVREVLRAERETFAANLRARNAEFQFLGMRWGLGLGFSLAQDGHVDDAEIVNGTVRVRSDLKEQPRAVFEYHRFFWCRDSGIDRTRGCGPFLAAASTDSKMLSGVALGFMYGWRTEPEDKEGFSVGLGAVLDAKVKDLGAGFTANAPPPPGETSVRFTTRSRWSTLLFVSRVF